MYWSSIINNSIEIDIDEKLKVFHNMKNIEHVLLNLIINSSDAFDDNHVVENKVIKIYTTHEENSIFLHIHDNAGGISEHSREQIFTPYFTTKEKKKGTGLGLWMSRRMVENIPHSTLDFKVINDHTVFTIKFPFLRTEIETTQE